MASALAVLAKSWKETRENPILFVPKAFAFLFSTLFFVAFLLFSGILRGLIIATQGTTETLIMLIRGIPTNPLFWLYLLLEFIVHSYFAGMSFSMYRDVALRKRPSLKTGLKGAWEFLGRLIGISLVSFLLTGVPVFLVLLLVLIPFSSLIAKLGFVVLLMTLLFLWLLFVTLHLFFVHSVLFFEKKDVWHTIKLSVLFGRRNLVHTLATWFIVLAISVGFKLFKQSIYSLSRLAAIIGLIAILLFIPLEMLVGIWEHVFIFNQYLARRRGSGEKPAH